MADGRRKRQVGASGASAVSRFRLPSAVSRFSRPAFLRLPAFPAPLAAALVGALCGLVAVLLVLLGERGCDVARGRPSCGGVGLVMLIAIAVGCLVLGAVLMRLWRIPDPGLVSFFGVCLTVICVMVFLIDQVFSGWMLLAVPLVAAAAFAASALLTRALENSSEPTYDAEAYSRTDADMQSAQQRVDVPPARDGADLPRYAPVEEPPPPTASGWSAEPEPTLLTAGREATTAPTPRHARHVAPPPDDLDTRLGTDDQPEPGRRRRLT